MPGLDTNTVLTIMKADTSQAEAAVKRLRGVERERARDALDDLNAHNDKLSDHIAMFGQVGLAVGAVVGAYKLAQAASRAYLEDVQLASAAAWVKLDGLTKATHGLVLEDDLLKFAGQSLNGIWKLSQDQMEHVLAGANALRVQGKDLSEVMTGLGEAVTRGSSKALRAFGIEAKSAGDLVRAMDQQVAALHGQTSLAGDAFVASGIKMSNAVDNLKGAFGHLVTEGTEPAGEGASSLVQIFADGVETLAIWNDSLTKSREELFALTDAALGLDTARRRRLRPELTEQTQVGPTLAEELAVSGKDFGRQLAPFIVDAFKSGTDLLARALGAYQMSLETRLAQLQAKRGPDPFTAITVNPDLPEGFHKELQKKVAKNPIVIPLEPGFLDLALHTPDLVKSLTDSLRTVDLTDVGHELGARFRQVIDDAAAEHEVVTAVQDFVDRDAFANFQAQGELFMKQAQKWNDQFQARGQQNMLAKIFGTPAEITLTAAAIKSASGAFNVLSDAGGAAMDAWITGSKSLAEAIKGAIGEGLRGLAVQSTVEALKHTAFAIGDLAFFNYPGAALHFQAAGLFAGVAVAAGVGAKLMGAGASTGLPRGGGGGVATSSAGSALGPGTRGAPAQPAGPRQTVIVVGKDLLGLPDLEQRQLIYSAIQQGKVLDVRTSTIRRG